MNRRSFIKSLAMAAAGVLSGAQLLGEPTPPKNPGKHAAPEVLGLSRYELTEDGYLEIWGQSSFPIYGKTGGMTGVMARYKCMGRGWFQREYWRTFEILG